MMRFTPPCVDTMVAIDALLERLPDPARDLDRIAAFRRATALRRGTPDAWGVISSRLEAVRKRLEALAVQGLSEMPDEAARAAELSAYGWADRVASRAEYVADTYEELLRIARDAGVTDE